MRFVAWGIFSGALAYFSWAYLALSAQLVAFGVLMVGQALALAAIALGLWRGLPAARLTWLFYPVAALELGGFVVYGDTSLPYLTLLALNVGGFTWLAAAGTLRRGSWLVFGGACLFFLTSMARGETLLIVGQLLAILGWAVVALRGGKASHFVSDPAQAGARP